MMVHSDERRGVREPKRTYICAYVTEGRDSTRTHSANPLATHRHSIFQRNAPQKKKNIGKRTAKESTLAMNFDV